VLIGLQRQERRLDRGRQGPTPFPDRRRHEEKRTPTRLPSRKTALLHGQLELFATLRRSVSLARGNPWVARWLRLGRRARGWEQDPEGAARRALFRLASKAMPQPVRDVVWFLRGLRTLGLRER